MADGARTAPADRRRARQGPGQGPRFGRRTVARCARKAWTERVGESRRWQRWRILDAVLRHRLACVHADFHGCRRHAADGLAVRARYRVQRCVQRAAERAWRRQDRAGIGLSGRRLQAVGRAKLLRRCQRARGFRRVAGIAAGHVPWAAATVLRMVRAAHRRRTRRARRGSDDGGAGSRRLRVPASVPGDHRPQVGKRCAPELPVFQHSRRIAAAQRRDPGVRDDIARRKPETVVQGHRVPADGTGVRCRCGRGASERVHP